MSLSLEIEYTHRYHGNGLAVVRELPEEWVDVVMIAPSDVYPSHRNMCVWAKLLTPTMRPGADIAPNGPLEQVLIKENKPLAERRRLTSLIPEEEAWHL